MLLLAVDEAGLLLFLGLRRLLSPVVILGDADALLLLFLLLSLLGRRSRYSASLCAIFRFTVFSFVKLSLSISSNLNLMYLALA